MKRFITTAFMLACIVACTFAQSIVGKWKTTPETIQGCNFVANGNGGIQLVFNSNKTFNIIFDFLMEGQQEGINIKIVANVKCPGKYTAKSNKLKIVPDSEKIKSTLEVSFPGVEKEKADILNKLMEPTMQEQKKVLSNAILEAFCKSSESDYSINGDVLSLDNMSFSRVK